MIQEKIGTEKPIRFFNQDRIVYADIWNRDGIRFSRSGFPGALGLKSVKVLC